MKRSLLGLVALLFLAVCGESAQTPAPAPTTETTISTTTTSVMGPSTTGSPQTTFPIEVVRMAEANGVTPKEAAAILSGQAQQNDALIRLHELVGEGAIVDAAFHEDFRRAAELTVFVVDDAAVALVNDRLVEAGLDPAKTTVEVAPEEQPDDPWGWLESGPYADHHWLESPGPHIFGAWHLVESNGAAADVPLLAGFSAARWSLELCSVWLGRYLTSAEGTLTLTVDRESMHCEEATETVERLLLGVIDDNGGEFSISFEPNRMTWSGSEGGILVWEPEASLDGGTPAYPLDRSKVYGAWQQSPGPAMEGVWQLQEVGGGEDPAAPVSLFVGVSTLGFEGQCNAMEGLFALSSKDRLATNLYSTAKRCSGPTGEVEHQMNTVLGENPATLQVSIEDDTMTWEDESGPQMIWTR